MKKKSVWKKMLAGFSVGAILLGMVGCKTQETSDTAQASKQSSDQDEQSGTTTLRLAFPTWVGYTPMYIAQEKGFFEKYGLEVELTVIEGLAERKMALAGGKLDGLAISADSLLNLSAEGMDVKAVYVLDNSNGSDGIAATEDITSPEDLKGKRVAVEENMCEHFFLLKVLEEYGMTADDIEIVPMNTSDAGAAFIANEVDACVVYEPYLSQCAERGANTFTTKDYDVPLIDVIGFTTEIMESNPEAIKNFIKAIDEADQYWEENPDECAEICYSGLGISEEDCQFTKSVLSIYDLETNVGLMGTEEEPGELYDIIKDESDFYYEQGVLAQEVDPNEFIEPEFVRELASE